MGMQPFIGPIRVPQMITEGRTGKQEAGQAGEPAADHEDRQLVEPDVVAQQLRAPLILAHSHDDAPKRGSQRDPPGEVDQDQQNRGEAEDVLRCKLVARLTWPAKDRAYWECH